MSNVAAISRKSTRRKYDQYYTPESATKTLLEHLNISGIVLEPCAGNKAITSMLHAYGKKTISTDIRENPEHDATRFSYWDEAKQHNISWVVTNPPYNAATPILQYAFETASTGICFLLRLSYLEPCRDRGEWLSYHPPTKLIVLPRISFTNDGKTDSTTTAWFCWIKGCKEQEIIVIPKPVKI